jgi:N,N'-diacetyllegionaminate synthase
MRPATIELGTRAIGEGQPCFVLAELAGAHGGSADRALKMIDAAFQAGADGTLLQVFRAERLVVKRHPERKDLEQIELTEKEWRKVLRAARGSGLALFVEPLDTPSLELAAEEDADAYRVHGSDMENPEFIRSVGARRRPVLFGTGGLAEAGVQEALDLIGAGPAGLLHGPPAAPTPIEEIRFRDLPLWKERYHVPVGFLDRTDGGSAFALVAPAVAATYGAHLVAKHFTLDRSEKGFDYESSLSPGDFYRMVELLRQSERARGDGAPGAGESARRYHRHVARSIVAGSLISRGQVLTVEHIAYKRTDDRGEPGFAPRDANRVIGRRAARPIQADETIREEMLE